MTILEAIVSDPRAVFDPIVRSCTQDLFASIDIRVDAASGAVPLGRVAVIGFEAEGLRGALGLGLSAPLLERAAQPLEGLADDRSRFDDWLGEAANQLLGRVKNRLLAHGPAIGLSLPMVLRGIQIQLAPSDSAEVWAYPFESDHGGLCVWLDVSLKAGLALTALADPSIVAPAEGELVFF